MHADKLYNQPPTMNQTDLRLVDDDLMVERARADIHAFAPIYERYSTSVFRMCLRATGDEDLADDLTAKVFLTVIERLGQYQPRTGSTFRSWLFVIARNTVHDHWRRNNRVRPLVDDTIGPTDDSPGPEEIALHRITLQEVRDVLGTLNERHRSIVEFRLSGLTTQEIAEAMGMTIPALKSAQTRAYATIRQRLPQEGESR